MSELSSLVAAARERLPRRRPGSFLDALRAPGLSLIAEHKRRSPSAGPIREDLQLTDVVRAYERGGAAALSILTEPTRFGGSLDDLRAARAVTELPILRKDFIVDRHQLAESLVAGADAVLLIVAALSGPDLHRLRVLARELGLVALVEVHDERELEMALAIGAELVGINNRNLNTLEVDPNRTFELLPHVPKGVTVVAESGFSTPEQLRELALQRVDAVLIGEALMRSADIEVAVRTMCK